MQSRIPFAIDECEWFIRGVREEVVTFRDCPADCFRFKKHGVAGPDRFGTPSGKHGTCSRSRVTRWLG